MFINFTYAIPSVFTFWTTVFQRLEREKCNFQTVNITVFKKRIFFCPRLSVLTIATIFSGEIQAIKLQNSSDMPTCFAAII